MLLHNVWRWWRSLWAAAPAAPPGPAVAIATGLPVPQGSPTAPLTPGPVPYTEPGPTSSPAPAAGSPKRHRDSTYTHLRRDLAATADYVLDRFEHLAKHKAEYTPEDVKLLGDLWGCDFLMLDRNLGERMKGGDRWSTATTIGDENDLAEMLWPIDYAIALDMASYDKFHDDKEKGIILYRIRSATAKEMRSKVAKVVPKMVHYVIGHFYDNGHWSIVEGVAGLMAGKWVLLHIDAESLSLEIKRDRTEWITTIMASALTARYEWHVAFGTVTDGPRLLFPTNPGAALHLFRNRDVAPGRVRRDQLKHWVEQHWRDNMDDLAYVCHHLRGHTRFRWNGFGCELFVSEYDLEKNAFFKQQAKEWRAQRQHNRVRVHLKKRYDDNEVRPD
jgi:hypothetical protein